MEKRTITNEIEQYIDKLKTAIHHPLLTRDLGEINIQRSTVFFLLLPMLNDEIWSEEVYQAALAVGAVQVAFDVHDSIHPVDATAAEQQLTVLAGDYYSGIHYQLLASIPNFPFIRDLSIEIGLVNEAKVNSYMESIQNVHTLTNALQIIDSNCIAQFFQVYKFEKYCPIVQIALPLITLHSFAYSKHVINEWPVSKEIVEEAIRTLTIELSVILERSSFLAPSLKEEIELLTRSLIGKTM